MTAADAAFPRCGWDAVDPYDSDERDLWMKLEHLGRYLFAADIATACEAGVVVDAGCGPGYGLLELARAAKRVIGVDSDPKMVALSHARLSDGPRRPDNVRVVRASLDDDRVSRELGEERAGLVVCFETLEHVLDLEAAVRSVASLLGPGARSSSRYRPTDETSRTSLAYRPTGITSTPSRSPDCGRSSRGTD